MNSLMENTMKSVDWINTGIIILTVCFCIQGLLKFDRKYLFCKRYMWMSLLGYFGLFISLILLATWRYIIPAYYMMRAASIWVIISPLFGWCLADSFVIKMEMDKKYKKCNLGGKYYWFKNWKKVIIVGELFIIGMILFANIIVGPIRN